ncbi:hypothetical protein PDE_09746 [Penicillium oxalicum 114-2]|uniref:Uncharacterized protein n=1 Tax=Penicillium oxalicum (strain 114-2 / CGMCC 5302) TaxID=933388 RepID=S8BHT5_PENO1|nr:hypothetical protein PDE_09746 [Penicillium oxalicum 114-2]
MSALCTGKTVVVTGAAGCLGQAVAVAFAAAGAERIAMVDNFNASDTFEKILKAAQDTGRPAPELLSLHLEIGDATSVDTGVAEIHSRWGHVDILINTTSHMPPCGLQRPVLENSDINAWWETWEVSVKDAFIVARALLPLLLKGSDRTVVNVLSASPSLPTFTSGAQDLSALAMMRLSEGLMLDYRKVGLLAYSLQLGHFEAELGDSTDFITWLNDLQELASEALVLLASERREWLGGRHIYCGKSICDAISRNDKNMHNELLKLSTSVNKIPVAAGRRRGRVPRSSY